MSESRRVKVILNRSLTGICILSSCLMMHSALADEPHDFARWEKSIAAFEEQDKKNPPPQNSVLFVGSSSIRLWDLSKSFPGEDFINRGFGGSEIVDSTHFANRIILKHKPRMVLLYAGDNDVSKGRTPEGVQADFQKFVKTIHQKLPKTKIGFIAIKPSIKRWKLADTMHRANRLVTEVCSKDDRLVYIDIFKPMLGEDGKPKPELFANDGLHLNEMGYKLWTSIVKPHLN